MRETFEADIINKQAETLEGSGWNGVYTKDHIPSKGEWERYFQSSSMFVYFSVTCILHKFKSSMIADTASIANSNCAVILDRMNTFKPLIDKDVLSMFEHRSPS